MGGEAKESLPRRILNYTRVQIDRFLPQQLKNADLNQGEGKLRASGMSDKDAERIWKIPDTPPIHDDTLPKKE